MKARFRLLDLFCGPGGAAMGYSRAGFDEIVGVDNRLQKHYPFTFVLGDALEYVRAHGREFDAIHASPPCQGYSIMRNLPWNRERVYPLLIGPVRLTLIECDRPWVIENVDGARREMMAGFLCGTMFGLPFYRHRRFATNFHWLSPSHPPHAARIRPGWTLAGRAREIVFSAPRRPTTWRTPSFDRPQTAIGKHGRADIARLALGVEWMRGEESSQAIPPAYTEFIGRQLISVLVSREHQNDGPGDSRFAIPQ